MTTEELKARAVQTLLEQGVTADEILVLKIVGIAQDYALAQLREIA